MGLKTKWNRFWTLRNTEGGFTLVELVVVIAILAILAGIAVPTYSGYIKKAREATDMQLIAAVNTAFGAACLEQGIQTSDVTDAAISVVGQKVFGISSVTPTTEEQLNSIGLSFNALFAGNENTLFLTENVMSLRWVREDNSFVMDRENRVDTRVMLANGMTTIPAATMTAIANSFIGDLNSETLADLMADIQDGATVTLLGVVDETVDDIADSLGTAGGFLFRTAYNTVKRFLPEDQLGAWVSLQSTGLQNNTEVFGDRYDAIKTGLESRDAATREAAMAEYTNAMLLYNANILHDENPATIQSNVIANYHNSENLVSTGGNGAKVVSAAIRQSLYRAYLKTDEGAEALAGATGTPAEIQASLTASESFNSYLESTQCANDIAGLVATMQTIQSNKDLIGTSNLVQQGMANQDVQDLFGAITGS